MKAISFSLYGDNPLYCQGMIANAELAQRLYKGWQVVVYVDDTVPRACLRELKRRKVSIRHVGKALFTPCKMFWRFFINDDPDVERFIVRDADSRLCRREVACVEAWEKSDKSFHVMRDHPHHTWPVPGGLWGAKTGIVQDLTGKALEATSTWAGESDYAQDQHFLTKWIWSPYRSEFLQHDFCSRQLFPDASPFPTEARLGDWRFVGERFSAEGVPQPYTAQMRLNWMLP